MTTDARKDSEDFDRLYAERERQDAAAAESEAEQATSNAATGLDATCMFEEGGSVKQQRDVAFALAGIKANHFNERQLVNAVKDWTIYGDSTLASHLIRKELITSELGGTLNMQVEQDLRTATAQASR